MKSNTDCAHLHMAVKQSRKDAGKTSSNFDRHFDDLPAPVSTVADHYY